MGRHLAVLSKCNLHESVDLLSDLLLSSKEAENDMIEPLVLLGNSCLTSRKYSRALDYFRRALQISEKNKPKISSSSFASSSSTAKEKAPSSPCDIDVNSLKLRIFECQIALGDDMAAMEILSYIPKEERSVQISYHLAKICEKKRMDRFAIGYYREVLRVCPFALDCAVALIQLGVSVQELIQSFYQTILETEDGADTGGKVTGMNTQRRGGRKSNRNNHWLSGFLHAHSLKHNQEYREAAKQFRLLEMQYFNDSFDILVESGLCHWMAGKVFEAIADFSRAHGKDPWNVHGMDVYAHALHYASKAEVLGKLGTALMKADSSSSEAWIACGRYAEMVDKRENAIVFAQKAIEANPTHGNAHAFKASCLLALGKADLAVASYREAYKWLRRDYFVHRGIIECYIMLKRYKEAGSIALEARRLMPNDARVVTLMGTVLAQNSEQRETAKKTFLEALEMDPRCIEAVTGMVQLLVREEKLEETIKLLREHTTYHSTDFLHTRLGDVLTLAGEYNQALLEYNTALNINPKCERAQMGIQRVEKLLNGGGGGGNEGGGVDNDDVEEEDDEDVAGEDLLVGDDMLDQ
eukprot:Nk52_evm9s366 gene=Nk52_evmTU9s366